MTTPLSGSTAPFAVRPRRSAAVGGALIALSALLVGLAPPVAADGVQDKQWYLTAMKAESMWKFSTGKGVKVAVVDSGVNHRTPSLGGKVLLDEVPASAAYGATNDYGGHGTTMAELIAGSGKGDSLKGLAPDARIIPVRVVLKALTDQKERAKTASIPEGIRAAADTDARIISLSLGGEFTDPELEDSIKYAAAKGKLIFAAAGNDGPKTEFKGYPAAYLEAIGVGAADKTGTVGEFSQKGDYVDLASPGVNVPVWCDETFIRYCPSEGTSQATAIASASAALIWSAHPDWSANQVLRTLIDTAGRQWPKDAPSDYLGYGLIRPRLVLEDKNIDPGPADVNPLTNEKTPVAGTKEPSEGTSSAPEGKPSAPGDKPSADNGGSTEQPAKGSEGSKDDGATATGASADGSSGDSGNLGLILGSAAAVAVVGAGAFVLVRKRRNA
ncbi:S8 family serine peptidase [Streptomyces uncialis]|uniref:S8 family serine peptidase n=1 Tax=Streptomyces uncialis TaxID=1048205 RepID=UPI00224DAFB7|nr:S8 family serine peptidase [Streptomyces uncialis]MCX4659762.1 S8 family serine peptidase [Streptomyces uncialis]